MFLELLFIACSVGQADTHETTQKRTLADLTKPLNKVVVITFDEETDRRYGAWDQTDKHIDLMARAYSKLEAMGARVVGFDINFDDPVIRAEKKEAFLDQLEEGKVPAVLCDTPPKSRKSRSLAHGHCEAVSSAAKLRRRAIDVEHYWSHPDEVKKWIRITQVMKKAGPWYAFFRAGEPSFALRMIQVAEAKEIQPACREIQFESFSERVVRKIPVHDFLEGKIDKAVIQGKFVLLGSDYDKLDAMRNAKGEQFNGVFVHALSIAFLLKLREENPPN